MTVQNNEILLDTKAFLVSETDSKGIIKFANEDYCNYAEYSLKELLGQPHSIVRHPDMPSIAFKDLWDTIQSGKKWRGFVKNRSKTGKFYWVFATVYPFKSCDGSMGYISCRRRISIKETIKYEALYKSMKKEGL
jgi:aerotaxis receptor